MERRRTERRHWLAVAILAGASCTATDVVGKERNGAFKRALVPVEPRAWEHETSDIPVDPRIRFGHLENGLSAAGEQRRGTEAATQPAQRSVGPDHLARSPAIP